MTCEMQRASKTVGMVARVKSSAEGSGAQLQDMPQGETKPKRPSHAHSAL